MKHEITLDLLEEIVLCIVDNQLKQDEACKYAKATLLECNENTPATIEIKAGVWCNDIPMDNDELYLNTFKSLHKIINGDYIGFYSFSRYKELGTLGCDSKGRVIHSKAPNKDFTTQVSYLDIIAAANAMED